MNNDRYESRTDSLGNAVLYCKTCEWDIYPKSAPGHEKAHRRLDQSKSSVNKEQGAL